MTHDRWRDSFESVNLEHYAATSPSVFVYVSDGQQVVSSGKAISTPAFRHRAWLYHRFFQSIVSERRFDRRFVIGVDVDDGHHDWGDAPIFGFQRPIGCSKPLLPDPDFLASNFYQDPGWGLPDAIPFAAKRNHAIFVGSTTGGGQIDMASLAAKSVPRVEAARFFRSQGRRDVTFALPAIVQCDSDAERALKQDGFGGSRISWNEQLQSKALISMDGNGATCSRVYVALASNSALVKYHSDCELFYFDRMHAFEHFVPVEWHSDVLQVMDDEACGCPQLAAVAAAGRRLAHEYLSREAIIDYSENVLDYCTACTTACAALLEAKLPVALPVRSPNMA